MNFQIREATPSELFWVHERIPEFRGKGDLEFYKTRLDGKIHLSLVAEKENELIGFKVGYQSDDPDTFYSWMGGVRPEFRKLGIADALAEYQENWARAKNYTYIFFKTRNRLPPMIIFGLSREFKIVEVIRKGEVDDYRIVMGKTL